MAKRVLAIGELLWDVLPDERKLGGAPANLAFRLKELGNLTWLLTRLGEDREGQKALEILKSRGFNTRLIQIDKNYPTGTVDVFFDKDKNPDYIINTAVAFDFIAWNNELCELIQTIDCIVFGTLIQRSEQSSSTLAKLLREAANIIRFCDINLRKDCYTLRTIKNSLYHASIVKLNHHEAAELRFLLSLKKDDLISIALELTQSYNIDLVLITLENEGALACSKEGLLCYSPGYAAKMNDPLGAGDAFSAAFLNTYLHSGDIRNSLEAANLYGALVVEQKGAMQMVNKERFASFLNRKPERIVKSDLIAYWKPSEEFLWTLTNV